MKQPIKEKSIFPKEYKNLLKEIKEKILSSQIKAAVSVNKELIKLYWEIGNSVYKKQKTEGWGAKTIEKLAKDLKSTFPNMKGFSITNIKYMVKFAKEYPSFLISQQAVDQIPWGHNILIMQRLTDKHERVWYINQTTENGWSRSVLLHWIDNGLHKRQAKAVTNFHDTLSTALSDLANQTIKDPYCFDFFLCLIFRRSYPQAEAWYLKNINIENLVIEKEASNMHTVYAGEDFYIKNRIAL